MNIHHINCLRIVTPINDNVIGHCMLLEKNGALALIDTGLGLLDTNNPQQRIGQQLIDLAGFRFHEELTAWRQIEALGLDPSRVKDCVLSHLDPDHAGGLADFPAATIHVASDEYENFCSGNPRYLKHQLSHNAVVKLYEPVATTWYGLPARKVEVAIGAEIFLVPLFGHTLGHCGVAVKDGSRWLFYIGDAYFLRLELFDTAHPVSQLSAVRADDNDARLTSLRTIKELMRHHRDITIFGYHDIDELLMIENEQSNP